MIFQSRSKDRLFFLRIIGAVDSGVKLIKTDDVF